MSILRPVSALCRFYGNTNIIVSVTAISSNRWSVNINLVQLRSPGDFCDHLLLVFSRCVNNGFCGKPLY